MSDTANGVDAIRKEVELYFGIENLMKDAFLVSRMNSRMMVPLSMIMSFKKMRQLSTSFDEVLAAVKQSQEKLVVEFDPSDNEWWIGPNPQALPESRCTVILTDVSDDVTVEDIEALTTPPLLHSYNFADGTWFATYQDKYAAKAALVEMQMKTLRGSPVKAKLKVESTVGRTQTPSTLNKNATPYQVPNRPSKAPTSSPSPQNIHSAFGSRASPVAGCPLFVSRGQTSSQRPGVDTNKRAPNPPLSSFYAMPPVQQQLLMMNFLMQQQMFRNGSRSDNNSTFHPNFTGSRAVPKTKRQEFGNQGVASEAVDGKRKYVGRGRGGQQQPTTQIRQGPVQIEALGADLPDIEPSDGGNTTKDEEISTPPSPKEVSSVEPLVADTKTERSKPTDRRERLTKASPIPELTANNFPVLSQSVIQETEPGHLTGWAAIIAKAPPPKQNLAKEIGVTSNNMSSAKEKKGKTVPVLPASVVESKEACLTTADHSAELSKTPIEAAKPSDVVVSTTPAQAPLTYASVLTKSR